MPGTYDLWTVLGSFLIACVAGYVAFEAVDHTQFSDKPQRWAVMGGVTLGLGIWSMHFVGMMAWQPSYPLYYAIGPTLLSVAIAIVAAIIAMLRVVRNQLSDVRSHNLIAAVLVGCGICAMHYVGMSALKFDKGVMWHSSLVILSLAIAIAESWAAMFLLERSRTGVASIPRRLFASIAIGIAICGMHYVGMAAFMPADDSICIHQPLSFTGIVLARIGVGNALLFTVALLLASYREKTVWIEMVSKAQLGSMAAARRLENMAAVEKIVGSVAREIYSPLDSAIHRLSQINPNELSPNDRAHFTEAQAELRHVASIAVHTARFFDPPKQPTNVAVPELIESALALFQAALNDAHIDVQTSWPDNLPTILCRESEVRHAIANLVSNAIDAMPNGGTLRLSVAKEKDGLSISITDTGKVIPAELREKILMPFFTSRGLKSADHPGLSLVSEIIRRHGGRISLASPAPGASTGSEFRFFLPFTARLT